VRLVESGGAKQKGVREVAMSNCKMHSQFVLAVGYLSE